MSRTTRTTTWFSAGRRALLVAALAMVWLGAPARVPAQEASEKGTTEKKSISEHLKEYWDKIVSKLESSAKAAGDEYHKVKEEAAKATGPAREKLAAEMETLSKKWATAREKLAASTGERMHSLGEELKKLEEKADKASGPAREKMSAEAHKLHQQWDAARAKMEATLSSNLKTSRDELEHLKEHMASASKDAKAKMGPRMERLKAEIHKDYDKLGAYLAADLKKTKEDMEKLRGATSDAAKRAEEALSKKYHELSAKIAEHNKQKPPEDEK
jgi:polyhydroxyalkanoate synthesis regulator phasin